MERNRTAFVTLIVASGLVVALTAFTCGYMIRRAPKDECWIRDTYSGACLVRSQQDMNLYLDGIKRQQEAGQSPRW